MADLVSQHVERILSESPIGMAESARLMGTFRGGKPCHPSTIVRWCLDGIKVNGKALKLECLRVADRLMTSRAAILRFLSAQQYPSNIPDANPPRSTAQRRKANKDAEAELTELGVK